MTNKLFILAALIFGLSFSAQAQCGSNSHHKTSVKSDYRHQSDIVDIAAGNDNFSTLVLAVKTADLVSTLKSEGPFTVFAPVNAAFAKIDQETITSLLQPEGKQQLTKILTYHVVAGKFNAKDIIAGIKASGGIFTVETVSGGKLMASMNGDTVILKDENGRVAAVTDTDIDASNGVIHVIDTVVLPK